MPPVMRGAYADVGDLLTIFILRAI